MPDPWLVQALRAVGPDKLIKILSDDERRLLPYLWPAWARPEQIPPAGAWEIWLLLTGRGWGLARRELQQNGSATA